jgi:hypothetical protein
MNAYLPRLTGSLLLLSLCHTTAITRYVDLNSPSPALPYTSWTSAATNLQDAVDAAIAGDEILVTNGIYATGGKVVSGALTNRVAVDKAVIVRSVNGPQVTVIQGRPGASGALRCVALVNGAVLDGFTLTNGATATNGDLTLEQSGGALHCQSPAAVATNCILVGNQARRYGGAAYSGTLNNCTLTGNSAAFGGGAYGSTLTQCRLDGNTAVTAAGGAFSGTLTNCTLTGNSAPAGGGAQYGTLTRCTLDRNTATNGGGASGSSLFYCTVSSNAASAKGGGVTGCWVGSSQFVGNTCADEGGGAHASELENCTLAGNTAQTGGGVALVSKVNNCIVYFNTAPANANFDPAVTVNYSCTTPPPAGGFGNIAADPRLVDAAAGNLRLLSDSPCINSGRNGYVVGTNDLDANPRISGGTVDMGAYELPLPASTLSYAWAQQYGLPTDGTADFADPDADGANNWHESRADTVPTNTLSVLRMVVAANSPGGAEVTWQSVATRNYFLERATNLGPAAFQVVSNNIPGAAGTKTFADPTATNAGPYFYRVGVQ